MAKTTKKKIIPDTKNDLIENLTEFSKLKQVDRATFMSVLEDVFRAMIKKKFGTDENFNVIVNTEKGDIQAFRERLIVEDADLVDENLQVSLSEALQQDPDAEIGEPLGEEISFLEFGRRHIMTAKQLLAQRFWELEKTFVYNQYKELVGEIVVGEVYQLWRNEILVMHEGNEIMLPKLEQIPKDKFKKGDTIRAVVLNVEMKNGNPNVIISRSSPEFLKRLFELEVPEIMDGVIGIKQIVRDPGERAKVAVESYDDRVDPVGACVGMRGSRIHGIVRELHNENIDIINYSSNPQIYIQRALQPAKPSNIIIDDTTKHAAVYLRPDQVSLAIGKGGQNVKLATKLTGYEIDVYREIDANEEDVDLEEFSDEIDEEIIKLFKEIGCDTAKSVLQLSQEELERRTQLSIEELERILGILRTEFEDTNDEEDVDLETDTEEDEDQ